MAKLTPPNAGDKKDTVTTEEKDMIENKTETSNAGSLTDDIKNSDTTTPESDIEIRTPGEPEIKADDTVTIVKTDLALPESSIKKAEEPEIKKSEQPPLKTNDSKLVTIRVRQNHECSIGSTRYSFQKRQMYKVPLNVKKILERANLLDPL